MLGEEVADLRARAVAVVGRRRDEQRDAARAVALVEDGLQRLGVGALAGALGDRALDVVLGHRGVLGLLDGEPERRVGVGVPAPVLGGHRDGARELREELAAARVDDRLLVLDPRPLGMTGHGFDASDAAAERRMRAMTERSTVVLVHGAWHGAWCWDEVVGRLSGDGLAVVAVDLPSVVSGGDMYDDARAVREVLDDTPGDKVVVGHSYGGDRHHRGAPPAPRACATCVYLAAFMLDEGQSLADVAGTDAARLADPRRRRQDDERGRRRRRSSTTRARRRSPTRPRRACARTRSPPSCEPVRSVGVARRARRPTSSATATTRSRSRRRRRCRRAPAPRTASTATTRRSSRIPTPSPT